MLIGPQPGVPEHQSSQNRSTRGRWDFYSRHRAEIERLIVPPRPGGSLCILGAGNCNDLDLNWAQQAYAEVHLVDIDRQSVEEGIARQGAQAAGRLIVHAPIDLTGIADVVRAWKGRDIPAPQVQAAIDRVDHQGQDAGPPPNRFDAVLSPCVLSQLLLGVRDIVGSDHPCWPAFRAALRRQHLRQMHRWLRPGGRGVLAIDLVSSCELPRIDRAGEHEVRSIMDSAIGDRRCFPGLEPAEIASALRRDPVTAAGLGALHFGGPWLWHLAFAKAFIVYSVSFARM